MNSFKDTTGLGLCLLLGSLAAAQDGRTPAETSLNGNSEQARTVGSSESKRIQNIAPEEMWDRVTECVLPRYPQLSIDTHLTGVVDIGITVTAEGEVGKNLRVLDGPPLLVQSAVEAMRQWKFRPNLVEGTATRSRARAVVRFEEDGTTAVELAPAILPDNFGDAGTPKSTGKSVARPSSAPVCKINNEPQQEPKMVDGAYVAGVGGIGFPKCEECADPSYTDAARAAKVSGSVVLHLVVTAEGNASRVQVKRGLGYGLDEQAVGTVESWRFKPAIGASGEAVAVWTDVEVTFKIK